jgi:DNA polymerase-1
MIWLGVDGTNWVHALYHALAGRNVLETLCRRVTALAEYSHASVVLVCFDRRSFRHEEFAGYKSSRPPAPDQLRKLLADAAAAVATVAQPVAEDGYEADDLLSTLASLAMHSEVRCMLASPDKDLYQCLVTGRISLVRSFKTDRGALTKPDVMTASRLESDAKTIGLKPWMWPDYQALVGESGDDVPGCRGWGPQTARRALANAGSIDSMLKDPWAIHCTRSQLATLQRWAKTDLPLIRRLVTLRVDSAAVRDALR